MASHRGLLQRIVSWLFPRASTLRGLQNDLQRERETVRYWQEQARFYEMMWHKDWHQHYREMKAANKGIARLQHKLAKRANAVLSCTGQKRTDDPSAELGVSSNTS